jgi:hypothetical protein
MTRPLRRAHFWSWIVLTVLLSTLLVAGLAVRRPTTPNNAGTSWEKYR